LNLSVKDTPSTFETPSSFALSIHEADPSNPSNNAHDDDDDNQSVVSEASSSKTTTSSKKPHEMGLNEFLNKFTSEDDRSFQDIIDEGMRKHKLKVRSKRTTKIPVNFNPV